MRLGGRSLAAAGAVSLFSLKLLTPLWSLGLTIWSDPKRRMLGPELDRSSTCRIYGESNRQKKAKTFPSLLFSSLRQVIGPLSCPSAGPAAPHDIHFRPPAVEIRRPNRNPEAEDRPRML